MLTNRFIIWILFLGITTAQNVAKGKAQIGNHKSVFLKNEATRPERDQPPRWGRDQPTRWGRDQPPRWGRDQPPRWGRDQPSRWGRDQPPRWGRDQPPRWGRDQPPRWGRDQPPRWGRDQPPRWGRDQPPRWGRDQPPRWGRDQPPRWGRDQPPRWGGDQLPEIEKNYAPPRWGRDQYSWWNQEQYPSRWGREYSTPDNTAEKLLDSLTHQSENAKKNNFQEINSDSNSGNESAVHRLFSNKLKNQKAKSDSNKLMNSFSGSESISRPREKSLKRSETLDNMRIDLI
ncbi:Antho-RFamide neuropeptides type 2 [Trichoplax sp. H2]|nr:Antho-RFamide neuropeptides type 2 [Trichoplax sp. H2]|eukprot:RDD46844.1 Antho-RFamide neuropeptides type 2 [Trichoplax sp. H2]